MDTHGKKAEILIECMSETYYVLWAKEGHKETIKAVPGVSDVANPFPNKYGIYLDPRYDANVVLGVIESGIRNAGPVPGEEFNLEPLECPFCNGVESVIRATNYVVCTTSRGGCGATGPEGVGVTDGVRLWNRAIRVWPWPNSPKDMRK